MSLGSAALARRCPVNSDLGVCDRPATEMLSFRAIHDGHIRFTPHPANGAAVCFVCVDCAGEIRRQYHEDLTS
jgi:hypothetical protein